MYLRMVQIRLKPELVREAARFYEQNVLTALASTPGCMYGGWVRNAEDESDVVSLTLWEDRKSADRYEQGGMFGELVERMRPYFSDEADWSLQLSEDFQLEYSPVSKEPEVKAFEGDDDETEVRIVPSVAEDLYLRIVTHIVEANKGEEFRSLYRTHVVPTMKSYPGCMYVQLAHNVNNPNEYISVTVWNTKRAATHYEESGMFEKLKNILRPTLSGLYRWKMDADATRGQYAATADDVSVQGYVMMMSKVFAKDERV